MSPLRPHDPVEHTLPRNSQINPSYCTGYVHQRAAGSTVSRCSRFLLASTSSKLATLPAWAPLAIGIAQDLAASDHRSAMRGTEARSAGFGSTSGSQPNG